MSDPVVCTCADPRPLRQGECNGGEHARRLPGECIGCGRPFFALTHGDICAVLVDVARRAGLTAEREVEVAGGRIDVLISHPTEAVSLVVVEVKSTLRIPAMVRDATEQAWRYARHHLGAEVWLVASDATDADLGAARILSLDSAVDRIVNAFGVQVAG